MTGRRDGRYDGTRCDRFDGPDGGIVAFVRGMVAVLAVLIAPTLGQAQETGQAGPSTPRLSFDAFGTLGFVYSTEDEADFTWNLARPDGPGHSEDVSPDVDSRLAGQLTATITPELTAVVQVVAEQTHEDDYTPRVEWASVRYDVTPELSLRAGRTALPAFMVSEYRKVSYANPWVRPPVEVYGLVPVFTTDGVDARYRLHTGDWTGALGVAFGRSEADFPGGMGTAEAENSLNVNLTVQRGGLTGRVALAGGQLDIDAFDPFFDAFRDFGPEGDAIAERYEVDDTPFRFVTAGVEYDPGGWFGMGEIAWAEFNSVLGERIVGYVSGGYRLGSVTPYATYSRAEVVSETSADGLSVSDLPPELAGPASGLNAALDGLLRSMPMQQNVSVGGRWDFRTGMALKLQLDFIDLLDGSPGTFTNQQPGFEPGGSAQLVSLATVFVL